MGRHSAENDATVHPLVADALARRPSAPVAAHADEPSRESSTGWPAPPPDGGGSVGWPGDATSDDGRPSDGADEDAPGEHTSTGESGREGAPDHAQPRRGWRRLFGASPAA